MATAFDVTSYPLETSTAFKPNLGTKLDRLSDKSVRLRTLTTLKPFDIQCRFCPLSEADSSAFETYLYTNAATEFDIPHNGKTYRGFVDGDTVTKDVTGGVVHWWAFDFRGIAV